MEKFNSYPPVGKPIYYRLEENQALLRQLLQDYDLEKIRQLDSLLFEKDMATIQAEVLTGAVTYQEITAYYLERIQRLDQVQGGTNAFICLNPQVLSQARLADELFQRTGEILSPVFGLPIAIKDNVFTKEMPTSVGTYLLREFIPKEDAPLVKALKEAGALIIGKANLSELANFMGSKMPSGYSSAGGQTLNPYNKEELTPLGSSSGSGVVATLNLAAATIGTETTGSITAPAAVTSTVGFKPSLHAAMDQAIFPLASTMDCPGPITRTVSDAIAIFDIIRQTEKNGATTPFQRIGISTRPHPLREKLLADLKHNDIFPEDITLDTEERSNLPIILADFALDVASFADTYSLPFKNLSELVAYNEKDTKRRALYGQDLVESAVKNKEATKEAGQKQVEEVEKYLESLGMDLLITFNNWDVLLPATAGYPELTIPYGLDEDGAPQGITLISKKGTDDQLLAFGKKLEALIGNRIVIKDSSL